MAVLLLQLLSVQIVYQTNLKMNIGIMQSYYEEREQGQNKQLRGRIIYGRDGHDSRRKQPRDNWLSQYGAHLRG